MAVFLASIVQLAATASRSPSGRRYAISCTEPSSGDHSQGMDAYEEDWGNVVLASDRREWP